MAYYFNKITDLIKNKVYVDSGPLETNTNKIRIENSKDINININNIERIPLIKEIEKEKNINSNQFNLNHQDNQKSGIDSDIDFNVSLIKISCSH